MEKDDEVSLGPANGYRESIKDLYRGGSELAPPVLQVGLGGIHEALHFTRHVLSGGCDSLPVLQIRFGAHFDYSRDNHSSGSSGGE